MDPAGVVALRAAISEPRFARYLSHCDGDEAEALRLYAWNVEITTAFWGPVSILEIVLRNAMHDELRRGRQDDWWSVVYLASKEESSLSRSVDKVQEVTGYPLNPDQIVGGTSLGFWVGLTGAGKARDRVLDYETKLWQPRLVKAFPHLGSVGRKQLHDELQRIRAFRNRLAHHEAVFNSPHEELRDLILEVASYLSVDIAPFMSGAHRIDLALDRRTTAVKTGSCVI